MAWVFEDGRPAVWGSKEVKRMKHKRKLTKGAMDIIQTVLPDFKKPDKGDMSGVCQKCLGKAMKAEKMERNLQKLKQDLYKIWIQTKNGAMNFKKSKSVPSPMRVDSPSPHRSEERSVFLPWSQSTQKRSNETTESAPTGHMDSTSERMLDKPSFLENEAMDSCNVQEERLSNDSMELETKHENHTDKTSLDTSFLEHDTDNFTLSVPSPSSPPRTLSQVYAPSPSSSSSSPVASPQSSDYTPSAPQLREQSVNVPWTRTSHGDNPMAIRSLRDVLPRKPMHEYERMEEGPHSFSIKPDHSDTDSADLDSNYEHRVIIDNAEIKSEPVDLHMEPVYHFSTNEVPPVRDGDNTELETKDEHPSNNTTSHSCNIKLEPIDDFTAKEEPPDNGNIELKNNDENLTNNKTSPSCDIKLKPTDSFTVKLEPPNS